MSDRALRPLALGDVFDEAFDLYKRNFLLFLLITAVYIIPYYIVRAMIVARLGHPLFDFHVDSSSDGADATFGVLQTVAYSVMLLPATMGVLWTALSYAACRRYLGKSASLASAYLSTVRRILPVLILCVVVGLAYGAASMLCLVGLVWPLVVLVFSGQSFVQEAKSPLEAVKRSSRLVAGDAGRVVGALLLLFGFGLALKLGFGAIINYLLGFVFHILPAGGDPTSSLLLSGVPGKRDRILGDLSLGITELVLIPFAVAVCTVLYFDFRVRKEAFDIELLAEDLGYPPLDPGNSIGPGYMPPAMPAGSAGFGPALQTPRYQAPGQQPAPGWAPPPQQPAPGWAPPGQQPAPGWFPPPQRPAPGWTPPAQQAAPGWAPPSQQPAPLGQQGTPGDWAYQPGTPPVQPPPGVASGPPSDRAADPSHEQDGGPK